MVTFLFLLLLSKFGEVCFHRYSDVWVQQFPELNRLSVTSWPELYAVENSCAQHVVRSSPFSRSAAPARPVHPLTSSVMAEAYCRKVFYYHRRNGMVTSFYTVFPASLICVHPNPGPGSLDLSSDWTPFQSFQLLPSRENDNLDSSSSSSEGETDVIPVSLPYRPVIASCNVNSLTSKLDSDIRPLLYAYDFAALALQETKLNSAVKQNELSIPNYRFFRRDRLKNGRNGGGVGVYARTELNPRKLNVKSAPSLEFVAVEITARKKKMIVVSVYKPPRQDCAEFVSDLTDILAELQAKCQTVAVLGDFNIDGLAPEFQNINRVLSPLLFRQLIQEPTHLRRCLDHIYLSRNGMDCAAAGTGPPVEKNHALTWLQLKFSVSREPKQSCVVWNWADADWDRARALLTVWEHSGEGRDLVGEVENPNISVNDAARHLTLELQHLQSLVVPHKTVWYRRSSCPWMSKPILRQIQRRNLAFKRWKTSGTPSSCSSWRKLAKSVKAQCKSAKKSFVKENFDKAHTVAEFWKCVRKLSNSEKAHLSEVKLRDGQFASGEDLANSFSEEFSQNFNGSADDDGHVFLNRILDPSWFCDEADVMLWISNLKNDVAVGWDGLSPRFLKACVAEIAPALSALLNRCLVDSDFPSVWKQAVITPIPKVPGTVSISEFRPISVLPVLSKIAETWMKEKLTPYIMDKVNSSQFAYAKGRSTEDAINYLQYLVTSGFNSCRKVSRVAVISFDVRKAFDQVLPNKLLLILRRDFKVPDALAGLLFSYLSDRLQSVRVGSFSSAFAPVISGVPQGSILGPHLFNAYISSVLELELSPSAKLIAFADDLLLVKPVPTDDDGGSLQSDINKILTEYQKLGLSLNPNKSCYLVATLSPGATKVELPQIPTLNGQEIERTDCLKYLGVHFDAKFSFGRHVEEATTKGKKAIGVLWRILGKWSSREQFLEVYLKQILPRFCYALPSACPTDKRHWLILEKCHRFAIRLASNDYLQPYAELLYRLRLKPISRLCVERQLLQVFKYQEGLHYLPAGVLQQVDPPARNLRRGGRHHRELKLAYDFFIAPVFRPTTRTTLDQLPLAYSVYAWNSLPAEVADLSAADLQDFKRRIQDIELFSSLEDKQRRERRSIPTLMSHYLDL